MGMTAGGGGQRAEINVTPMIDVLLVLIIIFMVITPVSQRGLNALIPEQSTVDPPKDAISRDIVVSVAKNNVIHINQEPVQFAALPNRLDVLHRAAYGAHFFVRGDRDLDYQDVARIIDMARGAGWNQIGLMTR